MPQWITASLCLLLILFSSTVQAVHVHGQLGKPGKAQVRAQVPGTHGDGEELCPLCAAMHSALASTPSTPFRADLAAAAAPLVGTPVARSRPWSFDLFSRPPPVLL